jgi:hypothetical protein
MNMRKRLGYLGLVVLLLGIGLWLTSFDTVEACTTAIIGPKASEAGAAMLWKNRDTGYLSNKVIFVDESPYDYLGLVNAKETSGRFVYAGLNETGFGIMNSVAYNLPKKSTEMQDLEGVIMAEALRTCRTVDDFEVFLKRNLGENLGSWANFGVIDSEGRAVIFEVHNHGYHKLDAAAAQKHYLINANFSRSGDEGTGAGYLRFDRATQLFDGFKPGKVTHTRILQEISRDFGHTLLDHPSLDRLEKFSDDKPVWVLTRDTLNRNSTSAAVVIIGKKPGKKKSQACMWVTLGEPLSSIALPFWVEAGVVPDALHKGETAPICEEATRIKKIFRPYHEPDKKNYVRLTRLDNKEGTGFLPSLKKTEREILKATRKFAKKHRSPKELATFQQKMADKALAALRKIK